jgi:uncharacterized membrane protein
MSVEDAAKLVISAGLVSPDYPEYVEDLVVDPKQADRLKKVEKV